MVVCAKTAEPIGMPTVCVLSSDGP